MTDDPQVVSISSSPPLSPDEIARKSFPAARRGVDGEAVRAFLAKVSAELRELMEREAALRVRVVEAEQRAEDPELDEATLTRAIGIETAKILWTAHDAAKNVVTTAEQRAAELLAEAEHVLEDQVAASEAAGQEIRLAAEQEAAELKTRAQTEAESLTSEAHGDAVELLDATKEECRRMVAEARELRNRTLADLAARRRALHIQLEELRTGKDSLLRVVDGVAFSVEELRHRLASAEDAARVEAEEAGQRAAQEPDHGDLEELEEELVAGAAGVGAGVGKDGVVSGGPVSGLEESTAGSDEISEEERSAEGEPEQAGSPSSRRSVDELFARIRASRAAEEAAAAGVAGAAGAGGAAGAAGDSEAAGGLYDIEAVTAAEAGGAISAEKKLSEAAEQAELEAEGAGGDGDDASGGDASGGGEPLDITRAVEIVTIVEGPGVAGDVGGGTGGGPAAAPGSGADAAGAEEGGEAGEAGEGGPDAAGAAVAGATAGAEAGAAAEAAEAGAAGAAGAEDVTEEEVAAKIVAAEAAIEADAVTEPDVEALARRDHLLGPITAKLGRTLKRALQDDQNELLNALRQTSGKPVLDDLIPPRRAT